MSVPIGGNQEWFKVSVIGFIAPLAIVPVGTKWRVRIAAGLVYDMLCFFGAENEAPEAFAVSFGDFGSSAAANEFVTVLARSCAGPLASSDDRRVERMVGGSVGDASSRDVFFSLGTDSADPVSAARAAQVVLFECQAPEFDWKAGTAAGQANFVPVREDPASEEFYVKKNDWGFAAADDAAELEASNGLPIKAEAEEGAGSPVFDDAVTEGDQQDDEGEPHLSWADSGQASDGRLEAVHEAYPGIDARDMSVDDFLSAPVDEEMSFEATDIPSRPFGVLVRDNAEEAAPILSRMSVDGGVRLRVDEREGPLELEREVLQRSFGVYTKLDFDRLRNGHLKAAMVEILGKPVPAVSASK